MSQYTVSQIRDALQNVCSDPRIKRVVLFGSYAKGEAQDQSDIDLYLDSGRQITGFDFFALKAKIEDALGAEIDLLPDLDIVPNSLVDKEIKRHGVTVYVQ